MKTPEDLRVEFREKIKGWVFNSKAENSPPLSTEVQAAMLEGYDDLMAYAKRIGHELRMNGWRRNPDNKYDVFKGPDASLRSQLMQGLALMPMVADLLETKQVAGDFFTAMRLAGGVIREAALSACELEWMPDNLLVDEGALGLVRLEDVRAVSKKQRQKMREV